MVSNFTYFVIGGGSGGVSSARRAADIYKLKGVAIAEGRHWGGTCVNVGCVPKKIMWWSSSVAEILRESKHYGFTGGADVADRFSWEYLKSRRDASVKRLNGIYESNLSNSGITRFFKYASFVDSQGPPYKIQLSSNPDPDAESDDKDIVTAEHVLIAVGGRPAKMHIPGEELCIDSDGFFELEHLPKKVAVIGAGYIAVELAGVLKHLGADTHIFCRGETTIRGFDEMLRTQLDKEYRAQGIEMHPKSTLCAIKLDEKTQLKTVCTKNGDFEGFDVVLCAIGRVPEVEKLRLDRVSVTTHSKTKHICVNDKQETCAKQVYAIGDVCGKVELTPMAIAAGRRLADRLFGDIKDAVACYSCVPTVVFSHPPIGTCGYSEEEAIKKYGAEHVITYRGTSINLYYNVFDIPPADKPKTFVKLVCLKPDEEVIGLHVLGIGADEMLQGFGVAMRMRAKKSDFDKCVAIHPSAAEEVVTLPPWGLKHESNRD